MNGIVAVILILLVLFLLILGIGNQSSSSSYWKRIRTLQHLADYINNYGDTLQMYRKSLKETAGRKL